MQTTLVLMAAGFGSRFGGGIKQIEPVGPNGEVLMDYAIHDALKAGFERVVFIIRRDIETEFRSGVGQRTERKCEVEYVYQDINDLPPGFVCTNGRVKPWGTGQAVLACRNVLNGPFCVLNADDYYGRYAFDAIHRFITEPRKSSESMELCMAGYVLGNTLSLSGGVTRGLCSVDENGKLSDIRETRGIELKDGLPCVGGRIIDPEAIVSMNIWGLPLEFVEYLNDGFPKFLDSLENGDVKSEYLLPNVVGEMIQCGRGTVDVLPTRDKWFGMTYAQDKLQAKKEILQRIREGLYPEKL